jgi:hypothetical protein
MSFDDEVGAFGPHEHNFVCWECGESANGGLVNNKAASITTFVVSMLIAGIVITPLVWLLRVTWGWALG